MTPEGRIKQSVNRLLSRYKDIYRFMPVPSGFGLSSLDYIICYRGRFISVETKAPGRKPTRRQNMIAGQIERAGGAVFIIDGDESLKQLEAFLERINHDTSASQRQTQSYRGAA